MLNYIWAGMLVIAFGCALLTDISDLHKSTYRNGQALPVTIVQHPGHDVDVVIAPADYQHFYGKEGKLAASYPGTLDAGTLKFGKGAALPQPLATVRDWAGESEITARVVNNNSLLFQPVRFVKLNAISNAAIEMSKTAVEIAMGLIGVLALWSGLIKIAEAAGLLAIVVKITQPILGPLFPDIPKGHPALATIALNLTAGMLGLGNAGTPLGLKAMEQLQELNPRKDTATDAMIMLLVLNTTAIPFVPSPTVLAYMGIQFTTVYVPIIMCTACCAVIGVLAAKLAGRLPMYRLQPEPLLEGKVA